MIELSVCAHVCVCGGGYAAYTAYSDLRIQEASVYVVAAVLVDDLSARVHN